jgi:CheY-like chemotaxis protein
MITVLYVDADPKMGPIVSHIFEKTGNIVVHSAGSGEEALELSARHHADVIVSDYDLPGINGTELLRALRSGGITVPFFFFTQYFTGSLKNGAYFPYVFRYTSREGKDKKHILKLLRIVCWVAGDTDDSIRLRSGINGEP